MAARGPHTFHEFLNAAARRWPVPWGTRPVRRFTRQFLRWLGLFRSRNALSQTVSRLFRTSPNLAAGGNDNNIQHQKGVEAAQRDYLKRGYSVVRDGPVAVDIPGFATPRFYDFIV